MAGMAPGSSLRLRGTSIATPLPPQAGSFRSALPVKPCPARRQRLLVVPCAFPTSLTTRHHGATACEWAAGGAGHLSPTISCGSCERLGLSQGVVGPVRAFIAASQHSSYLCNDHLPSTGAGRLYWAQTRTLASVPECCSEHSVFLRALVWGSYVRGAGVPVPQAPPVPDPSSGRVRRRAWPRRALAEGTGAKWARSCSLAAARAMQRSCRCCSKQQERTPFCACRWVRPCSARLQNPVLFSPLQRRPGTFAPRSPAAGPLILCSSYDTPGPGPGCHTTASVPLSAPGAGPGIVGSREPSSLLPGPGLLLLAIVNLLGSAPWPGL